MHIKSSLRKQSTSSNAIMVFFFLRIILPFIWWNASKGKKWEKKNSLNLHNSSEIMVKEKGIKIYVETFERERGGKQVVIATKQ
jgi:hypothetical protein